MSFPSVTNSAQLRFENAHITSTRIGKGGSVVLRRSELPIYARTYLSLYGEGNPRPDLEYPVY